MPPHGHGEGDPGRVPVRVCLVVRPRRRHDDLPGRPVDPSRLDHLGFARRAGRRPVTATGRADPGGRRTPRARWPDGRNGGHPPDHRNDACPPNGENGSGQTPCADLPRSDLPQPGPVRSRPVRRGFCRSGLASSALARSSRDGRRRGWAGQNGRARCGGTWRHQLRRQPCQDGADLRVRSSRTHPSRHARGSRAQGACEPTQMATRITSRGRQDPHRPASTLARSSSASRLTSTILTVEPPSA